jgi:predicted NACHT family NTPase
MAIYEWTRFWCLREGSISLGRGYLYVLDGYTKDVVTFDKIANTPCLALLGEPGIGKSYALETEIKNLKSTLGPDISQQVLFFNLRSYSSDTHLVQDIFEDEKFKDWLSTSYTLHLFLDSLDEGLLRIDTLAALLVDKLKNLPIERLHLRVACRTAEWSPFLESNLKQLWGGENFKAYELAPLQSKDVWIAAKTEGHNPEAFLLEIENKAAEPLAAKPVTLKLLLNLYKQHSALPATQAELYERGCLLLCEEENERRKRKWKLTAQQRLRVAARIAAITIFANKASIWMVNDTGEQTEADLMIRELAVGFERNADGTEFHVTEDAVLETLYATGLFTSRGVNRLGWQHQTYAEFLAAWYLDCLKLDDEGILRVLRHSEDKDGLLVPQLYETSAWIASKRPDIFRRLMQIEPLVLLRSDVLSADDQIRAALTSALLQHFADEKEVDGWEIRSYYSKLKHPKLAEQLKPYITDKSQGFLVRRVAIDIAEECQVKELQDDLAIVALDQSEKHYVRVNAAVAISEIGDSQTRAKLRPLALGEAGEDPDAELKGYGLTCVWPEHISAEELFNTITERPNLYGGYRAFLNGKLGAGLKPEDLPIALEWVRKEIDVRGGFDFDGKALASEIILKAWDHLDDEKTLDAFVQVVVEKIKHYDEILEDNDNKDKLIEMRQDADKRKRVLLKIFPLLTEQGDWFALDHSIFLRLLDEDVIWILQEITTNEDIQLRDVLIRIVKDFLINWSGVAPDVLTEVYRAIGASEVIKNEFSSFFEPILLDTPEVQKIRTSYKELNSKRRNIERDDEEKDEPLAPPPAERVLLMLDKFEKGMTDAWWQLNLEMTLRDGSKFYGNELEVDIRKLPGWLNASEETQERIVSAAKKYISDGDPKPEEWIGTNILYRPAFSGYRALWFLWHIEPSFVEGLSTDIWRKWASAIFHYPIFNGSGKEVYNIHRKFIASAYHHVPDEIISLLMAELDSLGTPNAVIDFDKIKECWDERLIAALRGKLTEDDLKPELFHKILNVLIKHKDSEAVALAHKLLALPIPKQEDQQRDALVAATSLLLYSEDAGWECVWAAINDDEEFGKRVVESVVSRFRGRDIVRLSETQIGDFYIWLSKQYPHSEDPKFPMGVAHFVGTREEVARWRDSLLSHLKEHGAPESVEAIEKIAHELPELDWLKWTLIEAKKNTRRHTWKPLQPIEVIDLQSASREFVLDTTNKDTSPMEVQSYSLSLWGRPIDDIPNLKDLITSFQSLEDRFTFFVGAGLSLPIFPLWDQVLLRMVNKCDEKKLLSSADKDELLELLNQKKDYLDIASTCVEALGRYEYRAFIEEQFDKDIDIGKLNAYQELFQLRPKTIITTNFDQIPERLNGSSLSLDVTSKSSNSGHYRVFTNRNVAEANNAWKSGKPVILKMHGCVSDQDSIVFTREDFRRVLHIGKVKEFLQAAFRSETVVFLGFGFSDPHIDSILSFLYEVSEGLASPHYVLSNDLSNIQKRNFERNYGVRVINYTSSNGHPEVPEFIRLLRTIAQKNNS